MYKALFRDQRIGAIDRTQQSKLCLKVSTGVEHEEHEGHYWDKFVCGFTWHVAAPPKRVYFAEATVRATNRATYVASYNKAVNCSYS